MNLSERLVHLRQQKGYSQQNIADHLGIHKSLYCSYEKGHRTPDLGKLEALSNFFEVPLRSLVIFPLKNVVVYSEGLLDELQTAIKEHGITRGDHDEVRSHFHALKAVHQKVLAEKKDALKFPELEVDEDFEGTISEALLDMRGEKLIQDAFEVQMQQMEYLFFGSR